MSWYLIYYAGCLIFGAGLSCNQSRNFSGNLLTAFVFPFVKFYIDLCSYGKHICHFTQEDIIDSVAGSMDRSVIPDLIITKDVTGFNAGNCGLMKLGLVFIDVRLVSV